MTATRPAYYIAWGYILLCAMLVYRVLNAARPAVEPQGTLAPAPAAPVSSAVEWFRRAKPYCNSVEIATLSSRVSQPPATTAGSGYHAACFALAGRIDDARRIVDNLPQDQRLNAVAIVFDVGHPVADMGDDRSAAPIMEMVVDYWPNHYMALYHAGAAEYMLGQRDLAKHNLEEFLKYYHENDGWTGNARKMLAALGDPTAAPLRRLPEPR